MTDGGAIAQLAHAAANLRYSDLPRAVVTMTTHCVLDTLGVALAGTTEPVTRIVRRTLTAEHADGPARIWGSSQSAAVSVAATINGTAAHALDFDDWAPGSGIHPSAPLLPALVAVGEEIGCSGEELITAYVAGYELQERLGMAIGPSHYARGFHTTGTVGTFGAATAASHLLGATAGQLMMALRIASTQAAGLKAMFGSMGKPLHAGRAATAGVQAARLAMNGFLASEESLLGPQGFVATHADELDETPLRTPFGDPWHVLETRIKEHAACFGTHAAIDAVLTLRNTPNFDPRTIEAIELDVPPICIGVCTIADPRTVLEAKFSIAFAAALALVKGTAAADQFTEKVLGDPEIERLTKTVRICPDPDLAKTETQVCLRMRDGSAMRAFADSGQRGWLDDVSEQDQRIQSKFCALAGTLVSPARAAAIAEQVAQLQHCPDIRALTRTWTPSE
ncbi:MmgE/PrpD family protein [Rhodococcus opacus]|uniref:MmgE/PrpD family protein n=1 Tax=Rhodococcus opacus TaxID=37919 RepID=A0AAX3YWC2_RHOOP|nr:MmgE/PrpD family protein [Rhodococcus opacus]MCZ4590287.1 MmgE/PrpD family protein [Rhodococcus opacus]WLF51604.1 MmgE/PrpD family protein [Rhodococcus opacus]WLF52599.1 MmgE/PrpD family protein [Rhodococcus opacus]